MICIVFRQADGHYRAICLSDLGLMRVFKKQLTPI
jgi:hypothetical protein